MRRSPLLWCCLLLALPTASCAASSAERITPATPTVAITNVAVVDVETGQVHAGRTVLIADDRILGVEPAGRSRLPAGTAVVDGTGRYLIPGLVDMHVHFYLPEQERDLSLYLANGVTTIRNMNAATVAGITAWRAEVAAGERYGPTIYTTGPTLRTLTDSLQVERAIEQHRAAGYDFIKVYSDLSANAYEQLARRAAEEGFPVVGHVPVTAGLAGAVRAGQQTLEHAEDLFQAHFAHRVDPAALPALLALLDGSGTCVVPTLVVFRNVVHHFEEFPHLEGLMARPALRFVGPETRRSWEPERNSYVQRGQAQAERVPQIAASVRRQYDFMKEIVAALDSAGVPLLAGSDANIPHTVPGFSLLEELEILVQEVGLTPAAALRAATRTPAECMGELDEFGAIAPGQRADLVLLEADPLDDIRNLRRRAGVLARGTWIPESELQNRIEPGAGR